MNWPAKALRPVAAALLAVAALLTTGCEDPNNIGVELPGTTSVTTAYRDLPVTAYTIRRDSLATLKADRMLAGNLSDANTGITTNAQVYSNLQIVSTDSLPTNYNGVQLDSVVLIMGFERVYGNGTQPARFDIYPLTQKLDERTVYTANSSVPLGSAIATNVVGSLNRTKADTASTAGATATKLLRLPIARGTSSSFANSLFALINNASFTQAKLDAFLKGYALVPSAGYNGAIVKFYPGSSYFGVFYHDSNKKSHVYPLWTAVDNDARFFTKITPDFSAAGPLARLSSATQSVPATETNGITYLQDGVGLATKLEIPGLEELRNTQNVTINRAELLVPVRPFSNTLFPYPTQTYIYEAGANNRLLNRVVNGVPVYRLIQANGQNQQTQSIDPSTKASTQAVSTLYNLDATNTYYSTLVTSYVQAYLLNQLGGELPAAFVLSPTLSLPSTYQSTLTLTLQRAALNANNIKLRVYFSNTK